MLNTQSKDFLEIDQQSGPVKIQQPNIEDIIIFYSVMLSKLKLDKSKWLKIDLHNKEQH